MSGRTALRCSLLCAVGLTVGSRVTHADESADIRMEGVLVTGVRDTDLRSTPETHHFLSADVIARLDATSSADILRRIPGVHVPSNSRGESIVFLRNAGERQAVVFLDGAMLNVPWDNRFDTSMLPGYLVGSVVSASGTLSTRYGMIADAAETVGSDTAELCAHRRNECRRFLWVLQAAQIAKTQNYFLQTDLPLKEIAFMAQRRAPCVPPNE